MKHNWLKYICILPLVAVTLVACKEEDEPFAKFPVPDWAVDMVGTAAQKPDWKLELSGNDEAPEWQSVTDGKYQYSMTAVVRLTDFLEQYAGDDDRLAAFVGNECRALATVEDFGGHRQYRLFIKGNNGEPPVTLRYYNAANRKLYELSKVCDFVQNGEYGTPSEPVVAHFEEQTAYAYGMSAVVTLPSELAYHADKGDVMAAFCGDECRGVGERVALADGTEAYRIDMRGRKQEELFIRYYSAGQELVYKSTDHITFAEGGAYGTLQQPQVLPVGAKGQYALKMEAYVALPGHLTAYDAAGDLLAAFVGDECRGVAERIDSGVYYLEIIGNDSGEAQEVYLQYYNRGNAYLYRTDVLFRFETDKRYGTPESPVVLNLNNVQ